MILGKVDSVTADGVTLLIDGESSPTTKSYQVVSATEPSAGDKVAIEEINGSYLVMGVLGASGGGGKVTEFTIPVGTKSMDVQLDPFKLYVVVVMENLDGANVPPYGRMALVVTQNALRTGANTAVHMFAYTTSGTFFSGQANHKLRISKDYASNVGYVKIYELI